MTHWYMAWHDSVAHDLTWFIHDAASLGGQAKCLMYVMISPALKDRIVTGSALKFAARCKAIVLGEVWMSHVIHVNESCHILERIMSHIWQSHVIHVNKSRAQCSNSRQSCEALVLCWWISVLQCVAVCCSVLQCVAQTLRGFSLVWTNKCVAVCCSVLQCVAVCCRSAARL